MESSTAAFEQQPQVEEPDPDRLSVRWWTVINELRARKQLPEWVMTSMPWVGTRRDIALWHQMKRGA